MAWVLLHMLSNGGSPLSFHMKWMSETRLDYSASGTSEHQAWCKWIEISLCYDMLNLTALAGAELACRRLQMIHERWKHKLPSIAASLTSAGGVDDDTHLLMGIHETRGNSCVAPDLVRWLGEELSKEASANKERRKAREERALAGKK